MGGVKGSERKGLRERVGNIHIYNIHIYRYIYILRERVCEGGREGVRINMGP